LNLKFIQKNCVTKFSNKYLYKLLWVTYIEGFS